MYNASDMSWMLKLMSMHKRDNLKYNFVTSCVAFNGSIPIVRTNLLEVTTMVCIALKTPDYYSKSVIL